MMSEETLAEGPLVPGARIGNYQIERRIGAGGMGTVYAGRHVALEKPVAIKTLTPLLCGKPDSVARFIREGRAASRIRHPHVTDVTDVGQHEGVPYLVMEYLEGEDLSTRLGRVRRLSDAEIARIMLPVCDAVFAAHEMGVVHRDLKPSNILLSKGAHGREHPMVLDFGLAKILDDDRKPDRQSITRAASFLGTPYYVSPEQAQSGASATALSDQYSLGAIMYELTSGRRTTNGENPYEVLTTIVAGQTIRLRAARPDVSEALEKIVEKAMAHKPSDRYGSLRELGRALLPLAEPSVRAQWQPIFDPSGPVAMPRERRLETIRTEAPKKKSRLALWIALLTLALAGAAAAYGFFVLNAPAPVAPPPPIVVRAEPAEAVIEIDGARAGTGRAEMARGRRHRIRVSAPGYVPQELEVAPNADPPPIVLEREPEPEPIAEPPPVIAPPPPEAPPIAPPPEPPPRQIRQRPPIPQAVPLGGPAGPRGPLPPPSPFL